MKRQWILGGGLALTLAATLWSALSPDADEALALPVAGERRQTLAPADKATRDTPRASSRTSARASPQSTEPLVATNWAAVERAPWSEPADGYFAAWAPPPPPPPPKPIAVAPAPPPEPVAPAFPYQLIGRLVEAHQTQALLAGPTRSLAVKAGDVVDGQWRVEQVTERGLNLVWLPAKLNQTLVFKSP